MSTISKPLEYLRDYVAVPSVNPMGRDDQPAEILGERRYAEHLREQLRGIGLDAELIGDAGRPSVVATAVASRAGAETLLMASHLDTVPVDGMTIPPFDPKVEAGRMYGRGTCDTKGGMAAFVAALEQVLARGSLGRNVILVGESDEELGSVGAEDVVRWLGGRKPEIAVVTEPTDLRPVTAHKGIAYSKLVAHGRACHSSNPALGRNAIVALSRVIVALDELSHEIAAKRDPRLGEATLSVGVVGGGQAPNIVPDEAWLLVDRRLLPGEDEATVRAELEQALAASGAADCVAIERCDLMKAPLGTAEDAPALLACQEALRRHGLETAPGTVAFGTDGGILEAEGIPSVVMGPGSIDQAHTADEWVETAQVEAMCELFVTMLEA